MVECQRKLATAKEEGVSRSIPTKLVCRDGQLQVLASPITNFIQKSGTLIVGEWVVGALFQLIKVIPNISAIANAK